MVCLLPVHTKGVYSRSTVRMERPSFATDYVFMRLRHCTRHAFALCSRNRIESELVDDVFCVFWGVGFFVVVCFLPSRHNSSESSVCAFSSTYQHGGSSRSHAAMLHLLHCTFVVSSEAELCVCVCILYVCEYYFSNIRLKWMEVTFVFCFLLLWHDSVSRELTSRESCRAMNVLFSLSALCSPIFFHRSFGSDMDSA